MSSPSLLRRPEAVDAARAQRASRRRCASSSCVRVVVELARRLAVARDRRGSAGKRPVQLPGGEEEATSRCSGTSSPSGTSSSTRAAEERRHARRRRVASRCADARAFARRRSGTSGSRALLRVQRRAAAPARARFCASSSARFCSASSRLATTPTAREASSTCTVGCVVLGRDLHRGVLPARGRAADEQRQRRTRAAPSPCATCTISSSDGVMRPDRPIMSHLLSTRRLEDLRRTGTITPRSMTS